MSIDRVAGRALVFGEKCFRSETLPSLDVLAESCVRRFEALGTDCKQRVNGGIVEGSKRSGNVSKLRMLSTSQLEWKLRFAFQVDDENVFGDDEHLTEVKVAVDARLYRWARASRQLLDFAQELRTPLQQSAGVALRGVHP